MPNVVALYLIFVVLSRARSRVAVLGRSAFIAEGSAGFESTSTLRGVPVSNRTTVWKP